MPFPEKNLVPLRGVDNRYANTITIKRNQVHNLKSKMDANIYQIGYFIQLPELSVDIYISRVSLIKNPRQEIMEKLHGNYLYNKTI